MPIDGDAEIRALRTVLRDLVALSAIPVAWVGREPAAVAAGLADVLTGLLRLDFVFVRLCVPGVDGAVDVTRGNAWKTFPEWLENRLAKGGRLSGMDVIPERSPRPRADEGRRGAPPDPRRAGDKGGRAHGRAADKRSLLVRGAAADPYRHGRSGRHDRGGNPFLRRALPPVRLRSRTRSPLFRRVSPARSSGGSCGVDRIA